MELVSFLVGFLTVTEIKMVLGTGPFRLENIKFVSEKLYIEQTRYFGPMLHKTTVKSYLICSCHLRQNQETHYPQLGTQKNHKFSTIYAAIIVWLVCLDTIKYIHTYNLVALGVRHQIT